MVNILKITWNIVAVIIMLAVKLVVIILWLPLKFITMTFGLIGWIMHEIGYIISAFIIIGGVIALFYGELEIGAAVFMFFCIMILAAIPLAFAFFCENVVEFVDAVSIFLIICPISILTIHINKDCSIRKDFENFKQERKERVGKVSNSSHEET